MLDRWAQKHDVKGHNESQRNISEVNTYRAWDFFDHSNAEANLLIDGGCADDRAALIASFVKNTTENSSEPVIILSQNQKTKQLLIEMAQADKIGELFVLDSNNNEYDFFSGMKKNNIINSNFPHRNTRKSRSPSRKQIINYAASQEKANDLRR